MTNEAPADGERLLPCPWCQSENLRAPMQDPWLKWFIGCADCGAEGPQADLPGEAIAAWNTRPARQAGELREALVKARDRLLFLGDHDAELLIAVEAALSAPEPSPDLTSRERIARVVAWEHFGIAWHHMERASHADVLAMVDKMLTAAPSAPEAAPAVDAGGWIVGSGDGKRWRTWGIAGSKWTGDRDKAVRYARRQDAEMVHAEDEDAWTIQPYSSLAQPPAAARVFEEDRADYEPAWRELHDKLSWMQGNPHLTRYLGRNFADVANDLIWRAYPDLRPAPDAEEGGR